jgi:Tol biopolymer transport system component
LIGNRALQPEKRRLIHRRPVGGVHTLLCAGVVALVVWTTHAQGLNGFDLVLVNVDGTKTMLGQLPSGVFAPRLSPDGERIAFETRQPAGADGNHLWIAPTNSLAARRSLSTVIGPLNWAPIWSVDGERLVFLVSSDKPDALYWRRADGTGDSEYLVNARSAEGWLDNGRQLRFLTLTGNRDYGISRLDMQTRMSTTMIDLPGSAQHSSAVSPDGRWMAYASNETGRYEVWLEPLPPTGARHQLTRDGGGHPMWLPDGRSIYFERGQQIFRLPVNVSSPSSLAPPEPLPVSGFVQGELRRQFDLMPDGKRFLMLYPR